MTIELLGLSGTTLAVVRALLLTTGAFIWTLFLVRLVGLRAFAKMTSFDFVATVATASLIAQAATRSDWIEYAQAMAALGAVFLLQWATALLRLASPTFHGLIQNEPRLLMYAGQFCEQAMRDARVSRSNLLERIRASSASSIEAVGAIVLETTGELTVLVGSPIDPRLLAGVRGLPVEEAKPVQTEGQEGSEAG